MEIIKLYSKNRQEGLYFKHAGQEFDFQIYYAQGGWDYAFLAGEMIPRGYFLSVQPVKRKVVDEKISVISFTAYTGTRKLIAQTGRFSAAKFRSIVDTHLSFESPEFKAVFEHVLKKNGIPAQESVDMPV